MKHLDPVADSEANDTSRSILHAKTKYTWHNRDLLSHCYLDYDGYEYDANVDVVCSRIGSGPVGIESIEIRDIKVVINTLSNDVNNAYLKAKVVDAIEKMAIELARAVPDFLWSTVNED